MANIRKSFNLRNGIQVDDDNFIVNANGLVGIGTSVPTEVLDVYGNVKLSETLTSKQVSSQNLNITGVTTVSNLISQSFVKVGVTSITSGIITATTGVVTYYGDGGSLLNLPTSQWLDVDVGLGFTSIYAQGNVGVGTIDPRFAFQIGGNNNLSSFQRGVGINRFGDIYATGIITSSNFTGIGSLITLIDASNITLGTLNNSRLSSNITVSGIITAGNYFSGTLIGVAATANDITSTSTINIAGSRIGVATITNILHSEGRIGIGTNVTNADLHIRKSGISSIRLTSNGSFPSRITFGRNATLNDGNAELRFGNTEGLYTYSTEDSLDIINYDNGNFNYYNNVSGGSGNYYWFQGAGTNLMTLTSDGKLGINLDSPQNNLHVVGTSTVTSNSFVGGDFFVSNNTTIGGSLNVGQITASGQTIIRNNLGVSTNSVSYTLQIGSNPSSSAGGVGINSSGNMALRNDIQTVRNINSTGILTCSNLVSIGNISGNNLNIAGNANITGILTASTGNFGIVAGSGNSITNINASNITSGTLLESRFPSNISFSGIVTASKFSTELTNPSQSFFIGVSTNPNKIEIEGFVGGTSIGSTVFLLY